MRSTNSNASDAQLEDDLTFGIFTISHIGFISHLKSPTFHKGRLKTLKHYTTLVHYNFYEVLICIQNIMPKEQQIEEIM